jgi:hypothetical protein
VLSSERQDFIFCFALSHSYNAEYEGKERILTRIKQYCAINLGGFVGSRSAATPLM